jgi:hypothetical protein
MSLCTQCSTLRCEWLNAIGAYIHAKRNLLGKEVLGEAVRREKLAYKRYFIGRGECETCSKIELFESQECA